MSSTIRICARLAWPVLALGLAACDNIDELDDASDGGTDGGGDTDGDAGADADTDPDSDTATDTGEEADTDWPDNPICDPPADPYPELETIVFTGEPQGTLWGGGSIASDLDGDGLDDLLLVDRGGSVPATTSYPDVRGAIYVFYGRGSFEPESSVLDADAILRGARESATAAGDVNGDGLEDAAYTSGEGVHLIYGSETRLAGEQLSSGVGVTMTATLPDGAPEYMKVSGGFDANGDGLADLLVDVRAESDFSVPTARTYLVLGTADPLPADLALEGADAVFEGTSDDAHSYIGSASAGDPDGDGFDDLLLPVVDETESSMGTMLFYGGDSAFEDAIDVSAGDSFFAWYTLWMTLGSLGDLDGDGLGDLALAGYDIIPVIYGPEDPFFGTIYQSEVDFVIRASGPNPYLAGLATGDVNGDGRTDIVIGDPHDATYGSQAGALYVVFGQDGKISCDVGLQPAYALRYGQETGGDPDVAEDLGYAVASGGDVNGDGFDDIVVGAPGNAVGDEDGGRAYLLLGTAP